METEEKGWGTRIGTCRGTSFGAAAGANDQDAVRVQDAPLAKIGYFADWGAWSCRKRTDRNSIIDWLLGGSSPACVFNERIQRTEPEEEQRPCLPTWAGRQPSGVGRKETRIVHDRKSGCREPEFVISFSLEKKKRGRKRKRECGGGCQYGSLLTRRSPERLSKQQAGN